MGKKPVAVKKAAPAKTVKPAPAKGVSLADAVKGSVADPNLKVATKATPVEDATPKPTIKEAPEKTAVTASVAAAPSQPALPVLGADEKHFEHPDGRIYVGPKSAMSIVDPVTGTGEILPKR